ncbi:hypothetical protein TNCV_3470481 [Trichonephila clavipes]|nr:hypothetical protein TNCV_3470481 [Trichonephila clavipes]
MLICYDIFLRRNWKVDGLFSYLNSDEDMRLSESGILKAESADEIDNIPVNPDIVTDYSCFRRVKKLCDGNGRL